MIMGREEGPRLDLVVQKFGDAPRDCEAIEGGGAAADFIENHETALRGVVDDVRGFIHLDHEGRLPAGKIIVRADARENAIHQADLRARRRHKAPDLRHQDDQARPAGCRSICRPCSAR